MTSCPRLAELGRPLAVGGAGENRLLIRQRLAGRRRAVEKKDERSFACPTLGIPTLGVACLLTGVKAERRSRAGA